MKTRRLSLIATIFFAVLLFASCDPDEPEVIVARKHYVKSELLVTYPIEGVKTALNTMMLSQLNTQVKYGVKLYKVTYKTYFEGDSIVASGTIAVPETSDSKASFPLLSFQHGTITTKADAPSIGFNTNVSNQLMNYVASMGFIVAMPDYIGFGATQSKFHPFMVKQATNSAVIDFIRASKEFIGIDKPVSTNGKLFLAGYSQGATATMGALHAIETQLANADIKVTAAAAGGGAYDLNAFRNTIVKSNRYDQPNFVAYVLESFKKYEGLSIDYSEVYNPIYAPKIPGIVDGIKTGVEINAELSLVVEVLYTENFRMNFDADSKFTTMKTIMEKNSVRGWKSAVPINLYHGEKDEWIRSTQTTALVTELQAQGASKVNYTTLKNDAIPMDHTNAAPFMVINSILWFKTL
jgi:alpha/beta superfamily hydrolase